MLLYSHEYSSATVALPVLRGFAFCFVSFVKYRNFVYILCTRAPVLYCTVGPPLLSAVNLYFNMLILLYTVQYTEWLNGCVYYSYLYTSLA